MKNNFVIFTLCVILLPSIASIPFIELLSPTPMNHSNLLEFTLNISASHSTENVSLFVDDGSLVGWWRMDNVSGNTLVDEKGINNGTIYGATQVDGKIGKALSFDGVDDYVNTASTFIDEEPFTFCSWIYPTSNNLDTAIFLQSDSSGKRNALIISANKKLAIIRKENGNVVAYTTNNYSYGLELNKWSFVVGISDGTRTEIYVNEVKYVANTPMTVSLANSNISFIGRNQIAGGTGNRYFKGSIDDVMIFNKSLTEKEIQALYANQSIKYFEKEYLDLERDKNHYYNIYAQDNLGNLAFEQLHIFGGDCTPSLKNTTAEDWSNIGLCINNKQMQTGTFIEYDENECGAFQNITHTETRYVYCETGALKGKGKVSILNCNIPNTNPLCNVKEKENSFGSMYQYDEDGFSFASNESWKNINNLTCGIHKEMLCDGNDGYFHVLKDSIFDVSYTISLESNNNIFLESAIGLNNEIRTNTASSITLDSNKRTNIYGQGIIIAEKGDKISVMLKTPEGEYAGKIYQLNLMIKELK